MRVVIVGAGLVGTQLAQYLIQEKHDVSLIESNEERARHASNRLDCLVIHDEGNSLSALEEAGVAKADALVCVTDSDEVNMIICGLAASRHPDLLKIARVRNDDYVRLNRSGERILGIDHFVHPDVEASRSVLNAVEHGALGDVLEFSNTPYELGSIDIAPSSAFDGLSLMDFRSLVKGESLVTLIERESESLLPTGATVLTKGDRIHVLAKESELENIFRLAGRSQKHLRKIGIVGGGRIGALVAEGLLGQENGRQASLLSFFKSLGAKSSKHVIIIEKDYALCKELSVRFPEALILNEDISDESFIAEERIDGLDLLITTTDDQELNIIASVYLKSRGVGRTIALVTGSGYAAISRQLGVDVVIPMKSVIVDSILSHLMGKGVKGVHRIGDGSIGIIEIEVPQGVPVEGKSLAEFRLPAGGLVMLVKRGPVSFIPRGDYVFESGDRIILIAKNGNEMEIEKLFGSSK
ncbi:Trk system potassium transporter TrkA [Breznakiella homolactica]|uniref:Trk system potassium uptake protein TrkA n=1 Tax=Breznakiella homolactica TaxID=2798577 RepID=A0A7T8BAK7_9SPIR|nr:Trk system potassium transporter TrkA [Breznakiella homolactica]QQO09602.1 Trk system potassium transporter TrkA [Breznakiella homolactica]